MPANNTEDAVRGFKMNKRTLLPFAIVIPAAFLSLAAVGCMSQIMGAIQSGVDSALPKLGAGEIKPNHVLGVVALAPYQAEPIMLSTTPRAHDFVYLKYETSGTRTEVVPVPHSPGFRTEAARTVAKELAARLPARVVTPADGPEALKRLGAGTYWSKSDALGVTPKWRDARGEETASPNASLKRQGIGYLVLYGFVPVTAVHWSADGTGKMAAPGIIFIFRTSDDALVHVSSPISALTAGAASLSADAAPGCFIYQTKRKAGADPLPAKKSTAEIAASCKPQELEPALLETVANITRLTVDEMAR
jgi:hypothetical protein